MSDVKPVVLDVARVHELISVYKEAYGPTNKQRARRDIVMYFIAHDAALQAEIESMRKDVERYRWLRSRMPGAAYRVEGIIYSQGGSGVDAGIDTAIAKEKQP